MESTQALENLGVSISSWDPLIIFLLVQKLPTETHELWEQEVSRGKDLPTWEDCKNSWRLGFGC